jgi:CheY-like chemotaxis protein/chemotaxis signal transduction protein
VLLIDDSEAVLAYERSALSGHYAVAVASDGAEGLEAMRASPPDVVVLDLSMPNMDGDELLEVMWADPTLRAIPVVIVSSEETRGHACVRAGAAGFLPKPVTGNDLLAAVNRAYDAAADRRSQESVLVLIVEAGGVEVALPVDCVLAVFLQLPSARPEGQSAPDQVLVRGEPVAVVDLPACLRVPHAAKLADRKLVVVEHGGHRLALCADDLHGPEEVRVHASSNEASLMGVAETSRGSRALLAPCVVFDPVLLEGLRPLVERHVPSSQPEGIGRTRVPSSEPPDDVETLRTSKLLDMRAQRAAKAGRLDEEPTWIARVEAGGVAFGIPLTSLLGVVPVSGLVPVPLSPPHVLGVVRFRGEVLAALSAAWLAGASGARAHQEAFLVAQSPSGRRFALDCERVPEPMLLREAAQGAAPLQVLDLDAAIARR